MRNISYLSYRVDTLTAPSQPCGRTAKPLNQKKRTFPADLTHRSHASGRRTRSTRKSGTFPADLTHRRHASGQRTAQPEKADIPSGLAPPQPCGRTAKPPTRKSGRSQRTCPHRRRAGGQRNRPTRKSGQFQQPALTGEAVPKNQARAVLVAFPVYSFTNLL